jgi:transposase
MDVRWKLRMAAAQREIWTAAQLRRLLAERAGVQLSAASVSALMRQAGCTAPHRNRYEWTNADDVP